MGKEEKARKEKEIYNQLFKNVNETYVETNRIIGLLRECNTISSDVPDIIAVDEKDKIAYGIEIFRVDHHIRNQHGKIGASSYKVKKEDEKIQNRYKDNLEEHYLDVANEINNIIAGELENMFNATYVDLLKSLDHSFDNHCKKIELYKQNKSFPKGFNKKIIFLIEIYADFHNLYKCEYRKNEMNKRGLMPLFDDVVDRFKRSKIYGVDYIILLLKTYRNEDMEIIALNSADIDEAIKLNSLKTYSYCGIDNYIKYSEDKVLSIEFNNAVFEEDVIKAYHRDDFHIQNNPYYLPAIFTAAKKAMEYKNIRKSYAIERSVLFFLEVYSKNIIGWRQSIDDGLVEPIFNQINPIDIIEEYRSLMRIIRLKNGDRD